MPYTTVQDWLGEGKKRLASLLEPPSTDLTDEERRKLGVIGGLPKQVGSFLSRQLLEPAPELEKPVRAIAERVPALSRPSEAYGTLKTRLVGLAEALALGAGGGIGVENAPEIATDAIRRLNPLHTEKAKPIEAVALGTALLPSRAQALETLLGGVAGGGLYLGSAISRGEKAAKLAQELSGEGDALKAMQGLIEKGAAQEKRSFAARDAYKAALAEAPDDVAAAKKAARAAAKPPEVPIEAAPEFGARSRPNPVAQGWLRSASDAMRRLGGTAHVPRESAEGIANAAENVRRDMAIIGNEGEAMTGPYLDVLSKMVRGKSGEFEFKNRPLLPGRESKSALEAEKSVAKYLDTGESTGSDILDQIGGKLREYTSKRLEESRTALPGKDIGEIKTYLPRVNERLRDAVNIYGDAKKGGPQGAVDYIQNLYSESGKEPGDPAAIRAFLDDIAREKTDKAESPLSSVAVHLERSRRMDLPGHIADYSRQDYKPGELARAFHLYNAETAFRIADAKHFGVDAEKFKAWRDAIQTDPSAKEFANLFRKKMIGGLSSDPLESETNDWLSSVRQYQAASKLGRAYIANAVQTAITTLPQSIASSGITRGFANYAKAVAKSYATDMGKSADYARSVGALYDETLHEIAGIGHSGWTSKLAHLTLTGTPFKITEAKNNTISAVAGALTAEDLVKDIAAGKKGAEGEVRRLLRSTPEDAARFILAGRTGQLDERGRDLIAYQFAVRGQFRADPSSLPIRWQTPTAKTWLQFKNFTYNYSRFVNNELIGAAKRGNYAPLLAWMTSEVATGESIRAARKITALQVDWNKVRSGDYDVNKDKNETYVARVLNDMITSAGVGLMGEGVLAATGGDAGKALSFAAGPTFGEAFNVPQETLYQRGGLLGAAMRRAPIGAFGAPQIAERVMRERGMFDRPFLATPPFKIPGSRNKARLGIIRGDLRKSSAPSTVSDWLGSSNAETVGGWLKGD